MKLTENRVDTLIDILNDLICDEQSITREQRENLIKTVATLGGLKERLRLISAEKWGQFGYRKLLYVKLLF